MTILLCKALPVAFSCMMLMTGCKKKEEAAKGETLAPAAVLSFSAEQATNSLKRVEELIKKHTPRDAGTPEGAKAAEWLCEQMKKDGITARLDSFTDETPKGEKTFVNALGEIKGSSDEWIILLSHFDTKVGIDRTFEGANDSGSSTGLLLELAAAIKNAGRSRCNFLFGFMDGEECLLAYSDRDGFHGSKKLAKDLKAKKTKIKAVILMDMIGDRDFKITIPRNSSKELKLLALRAADATGDRDKIGLHNYNIFDDHQAFLDLGYPAINLIDFHFGSKPGANDYWHTMEDSMDKLSAESMLVTGRIVMEMINELQK